MNLSIKKISDSKKEIESIRGLIEVYEEMSATKMQKIREEIINARDFFDKLAELSVEIGADLDRDSFAKNGDVCVFVSSSTGLYGDLIDSIFVKFSNFIKANPKFDRVVVGKLGNSLMQSYNKGVDFTYYDMADEGLVDAEYKTVLAKLMQYKRIHLFYGKFKNIVTQETWTQVISGQVLGNIQELVNTNESLKFIYEPDPEFVSKVFSEEIASSIFSQSIDENKLAKYASRLMYLDLVIEKIDDKLNTLAFQGIRAKKRRTESKQLVSFAAMNQNY